jgi:hypothetical protein
MTDESRRQPAEAGASRKKMGGGRKEAPEKKTARSGAAKTETISVVNYIARKGVHTADWKFYERMAELAGVSKATPAEWRRILGI